MDDVAQSFGADPPIADRKRDEVGARIREQVHRAEVGRGLECDRISALKEERRDEPDRLLRAARDQDLLFPGRQPAGVEPGGDRAPQLGQARGQVSVVSREPRDPVLQGEDLPGDRSRAGKVRAQELDRPAGTLDQASIDRVAPKRGRLVPG